MKKRFALVFLAVMLIMTAIPVFSVSAADPTVEFIDGVNTAFLSSFGKITYNGEVHTAFRTFDEALAALGTAGGRIVFTGTINLGAFVDTPGRGQVIFEGIGSKVTGSVLDFQDAAKVEWQGDTYVNNVQLKTNPDVPIYTNGHIFETTGNFECLYSEKFVQNSNNIITYTSPFIFAAGVNASGEKLETVSLNYGHYKAIVGGSYAENNVSADTSYELGGGSFENVYAGNFNSTGTFSGNSEIKITDGTVTTAVLGSESGTTNANLALSIYGGKIENLYIGSANAAYPVNGNICLSLFGGDVSSVIPAKNTVSGKVIIVDSTKSSKITEGMYDYYITADGTTIKPVYNGTTLAGFSVSDENGFIPAKVYANGTEISHVNGVFTLPEGKVTVTCESAASINPNKYASYVNGYSDGTFLPQNNITRAEAITMLARIICEDTNALSSIVVCDYKDVAATDWYAGVVGYFEKLGYLEKMETGVGTLINPNQYITRGEFAEISRHIISEIYGGRQFGIQKFSDVSSGNPYYDSIGQLGYLGVIGGYEDGTFRPDANITRAEAVTIVNRMLGRTPTGNGGSVSFSDIEGHWAKPQIITACNPAQVGDVAVWTVVEDITKGSFTLLDGADVTVGDQIRNLRSQIPSISTMNAVAGIDAISKWQIDKIVNSPSEYPTTGNVFYVSPNGNDENDGLSPATAWKSLTKLTGIAAMKNIKAGDTVLFERGGEWRGQLGCINGVTYSAYGIGAKPVFNSSKRNYADASLWSETEYPNIYKLSDKIVNVGIMAFDFTGILGNYNEIVGTMKVKGVGGFEDYADLKNDLEFYCNHSTAEVYLYCEGGNPGTRFKNIEIGGYGNSVSIPKPGNVTLDNLTFRFTGSHAIGVGGHKNITVRNCTFDYLGGSILSGFHGANTTRYGNALQVYGSCDGWYLYNNWMYQIYDTGVTHQYNSPYDHGSATMDNVKYIGNVIEYCHWSIEYYNPDYEDTKHTFYNTYIADNICRLNGYGWGSVPRMSSSTLFQSAGITKNTENFLTENNIFDRSAGKLINLWSDGDRELVLRDNIYVQKANDIMGALFGTSWYANDSSATVLEKMTGDSTSNIIFNNDTSVNNYLVEQR